MPSFSKLRHSSTAVLQSALFAAITITVCPVQASPEIHGKWRAVDGSVTVNISSCSDTAHSCATVVEEVLQPGEESNLGKMIVKDIRKDVQKGWKGKYIDGKSTYDADIKSKENGQIDFKICVMLFLCETLSFARVQ